MLYGLKYTSAWAFGRTMRTAGGRASSPAIWKNFWFRGFTANDSPVIDSIDPTYDSSTNETLVTISGYNFGASQGEGFVFCKHSRVASYTSWSDTEIVCRLGFQPSFDGLSDLFVTRDTGQYGSLVDAFNAIPKPYIQGITPIVSVYGGNTVVILGENFTSSGSVTFAGTAAESIVSWTDNRIECIAPGHLVAGSISVVVTNSVSESSSISITASSDAAYIVRLFCDPAAVGSANGLYPEDAFTSFAAALTAVVAGQTVYCRGTESGIVNKIYIEKNGLSGAYINVVGVNSSWIEDGTQYSMQFNTSSGSSVPLIEIRGIRWRVKNILISNLGTDYLALTTGINSSSSYESLYNISLGSLQIFQRGYRCFYRRVSCGLISNANGYHLFCHYGALASYGGNVVIASIINGTYSTGANDQTMLNSVIDSSSGDALQGAASTVCFGVRITNNSGWARKSNNQDYDIFEACFIDNNSSGDIQDNPNRKYLGLDQTLFDGTQGYIDQPNGNYNLILEASVRSVGIKVGCSALSNVNMTYMTAGLNPSLSAQVKTKTPMTKYVGIWCPRG